MVTAATVVYLYSPSVSVLCLCSDTSYTQLPFGAFRAQLQWVSVDLCSQQVLLTSGPQEERNCWEVNIWAAEIRHQQSYHFSRIHFSSVSLSENNQRTVGPGAVHRQWGGFQLFTVYLNELFRPATRLKSESLCIFCLRVHSWRILTVGNEGQGRFVSQLHAPVDGWASELGLPRETSPVVAQNPVVRNNCFSILFWASVSRALRHVLKCVEYICHTGSQHWHFCIKPVLFCASVNKCHFGSYFSCLIAFRKVDRSWRFRVDAELQRLMLQTDVTGLIGCIIWELS